MAFLKTLIEIYGDFITFIFTFQIDEGVTLGYLALGLLLIAVIFIFLIGRLKRSR